MHTPINLDQNQDPEMMNPEGLTSPSISKPRYPAITLHGPKSHRMPKHGTAKVKYHVIEKKSTMPHGRTHHSAVVHLHNFAPMGMASTPTDEEAIEDAMNQSEDEQVGS